MAADVRTKPLEDRVRELEAQVATLRDHVAKLERWVENQPEHTVDQRLTRSKVAYDWQQ